MRGFVVGFAALSLVGCAEQQEALIVLHAPAWSNGECAIDGNSDVGLINGALDLSFETPYLLPLIVLNQLPSQGADQSSSGIDNAEVQLSDADVKLRMPQRPEVIEALQAQDPALVEFNVQLPTDSISPGERHGVAVEVVSDPAASALAAELGVDGPAGNEVAITLLADVTLRGKRSGNTSGNVGFIEAREYTFPIELCDSCLFSCVTCEAQTCPVDTMVLQGGVCGNAQDGILAPAACGDPNAN